MKILLFFVLLPINLINAEDTCGKVSIRSGLVVNGEATQPGEFPFLTALYKLETDQFFCAGSLITRRHVLTGKKNKSFLKKFLLYIAFWREHLN
jgi:secreted trypsin-like serine protease